MSQRQISCCQTSVKTALRKLVVFPVKITTAWRWMWRDQRSVWFLLCVCVWAVWKLKRAGKKSEWVWMGDSVLICGSISLRTGTPVKVQSASRGTCFPLEQGVRNENNGYWRQSHVSAQLLPVVIQGRYSPAPMTTKSCAPGSGWYYNRKFCLPQSNETTVDCWNKGYWCKD